MFCDPEPLSATGSPCRDSARTAHGTARGGLLHLCRRRCRKVVTLWGCTEWLCCAGCGSPWAWTKAQVLGGSWRAQREYVGRIDAGQSCISSGRQSSGPGGGMCVYMVWRVLVVDAMFFHFCACMTAPALAVPRRVLVADARVCAACAWMSAPALAATYMNRQKASTQAAPHHPWQRRTHNLVNTM